MGRKRLRAYQVAWAARHGWLPKYPYVLSHVCHGKCLTVEHMEAVPQALNASRTACKNALRKNKKRGDILVCSNAMHTPRCFIGDA